MKTCRVCQETIDETLFAKRNEKFDTICKNCKNQQQRNRANRNPIQMEGTQICKVCGEEKEIEEYGIDKLYKNGRRTECRKCVSEYRNSITSHHREEMNEYYWSRKAKSANRRSGEKVTSEELKRLFDSMDKKECSYCSQPLSTENLEVDHKVPLSKGGRNVIENIEIICSDCNFLKLDMTDEEFLSFLIEYARQVQNSLRIIRTKDSSM